MAIYFIQAGEGGPIKIGQSENPQERLNQLQTANPYKLKMLWVYNKEKWTEAEIHDWFEDYRIRGEWFKPTSLIFDFISDRLNLHELNDSPLDGRAFSSNIRYDGVVDFHYIDTDKRESFSGYLRKNKLLIPVNSNFEAIIDFNTHEVSVSSWCTKKKSRTIHSTFKPQVKNG